MVKEGYYVNTLLSNKKVLNVFHSLSLSLSISLSLSLTVHAPQPYFYKRNLFKRFFNMGRHNV